mgnify:CR=1 FL=1
MGGATAGIQEEVEVSFVRNVEDVYLHCLFVEGNCVCIFLLIDLVELVISV